VVLSRPACLGVTARDLVPHATSTRRIYRLLVAIAIARKIAATGGIARDLVRHGMSTRSCTFRFLVAVASKIFATDAIATSPGRAAFSAMKGGCLRASMCTATMIAATTPMMAMKATTTMTATPTTSTGRSCGEHFLR
jgi:hypothetical protein